MGRKCLKCGYERIEADRAPGYECPACGAVYKKVEAALKKKERELAPPEPPPPPPLDPPPQETPQPSQDLPVLPIDNKHLMNFVELHCKEGESIVAWGNGYLGRMLGKGDTTQRNGVLVVTPDRVVFYRKGLLGEIIETIPLKDITSIERKSFLMGRTIRMHASHDQLEFKTFNKEMETRLVRAIEAGRESVNSGKDAARSDPMEALKKLGELKSMGLITEDEFQEKRAILLARL